MGNDTFIHSFISVK